MHGPVLNWVEQITALSRRKGRQIYTSASWTGSRFLWVGRTPLPKFLLSLRIQRKRAGRIHGGRRGHRKLPPGLPGILQCSWNGAQRKLWAPWPGDGVEMGSEKHRKFWRGPGQSHHLWSERRERKCFVAFAFSVVRRAFPASDHAKWRSDVSVRVVHEYGPRIWQLGSGKAGLQSSQPGPTGLLERKRLVRICEFCQASVPLDSGSETSPSYRRRGFPACGPPRAR